MLIKKILLPVDFPTSSLGVMQQAVTLAERFHSQIILLHVETPERHEAGMPKQHEGIANSNLVAEVLRGTKQAFDASFRTKLESLAARGLLVKGDPAHAILQAAEAENADLIMMPSHGHTFDEFLLGSVTAKVLRWRECPLWTGAHTEEPSAREFAIHNILCAVDLGLRSQEVASWAAQLAAEFGAQLTLSNVTESMAILAPGGTWTNPQYQQPLVDDALQRLTQLQKNLSIKTDLLVGIGDVPKALNQMAKTVKAELLVLECYPYSGNLRMHGYAIICTVSIPVLSV